MLSSLSARCKNNMRRLNIPHMEFAGDRAKEVVHIVARRSRQTIRMSMTFTEMDQLVKWYQEESAAVPNSIPGVEIDKLYHSESLEYSRLRIYVQHLYSLHKATCERTADCVIWTTAHFTVCFFNDAANPTDYTKRTGGYAKRVML